MRRNLFAILVLINAGPVFCATDPVAEIKSFSSFKEINPEMLVDGRILGQSGPLMDFQRGISVQTCFVVMAPVKVTARMLQTWDPSQHESLKVHFHRPVRSPPGKEDFKSCVLNSNKPAVRRLINKTVSTTPEKSDLQLSRAEAAQIAKCMKQTENEAETSPEQLASVCWSDILRARVLRFQKEGLAGTPSCETGGSTITPVSEIRSLLKEDPKVTTQFSKLLSETSLTASKPASSKTVSASYYWELFEADLHATFDLGVIYVKPSKDGFQVLDCQYFASGNYYVYLTFYQLWPIQVGNKSATLIWRGDFLSARSVADTRGTERMMYGGVMSQEIKKAIRFFQEDLTEAP